MVKNTTGGNKSKGYARKDSGAGSKSNKLRQAIEEGELYAIVTKMTGNGTCNVLCIDSIERLCFIRGKFKGKGMHNNLISPGSYVLVGERGWESTDKKNTKPKCDLLEVYSSVDKERLQISVSANWSVLTLNDVTNQPNHDKNVVFLNEKEEEYRETIAKSIALASTNNNGTNLMGNDGDVDDEIDIDAI
jgi:initiation factor 1A